VGGDELTGLRAFDRKIGRLIRDQQKHVAVAVTRGDTSLELRLELPPLARRR
jgi:hypothetical protein